MRKQKLQFYTLLLILVLVVFGYLYARHVSRSYEEADTTPTFELIEDAEAEDTENVTEDAGETAKGDAASDVATEDAAQ